MFILFLWMITMIHPIISNHFNGGTISWVPVTRNTTSSSVMITITQSYSWMYPTVTCQTNVPTSTNWILYPATNLICIGNCSNQGGYSSNPINILTDCTSYSASLGILTSQRSVNVTFNESTYFWIAYQGISWRSLANAATSSNPGWSIVSLINLRRRPDGLFNTPPVARITSPQYVVANRTTIITIPVTDVDIRDDLRCRWSLKNSPSGIDECDDICTSASIMNLVNLTGCTLTFTATTPNNWYALALQVEDFFNANSTDTMSSVAIQFLIHVLPSPTCTQAPVILPLTGCLQTQVNVPMSFTLYAINYCNRTRVIVTDILSTVNIDGISASTLMNSTTNASLVSVTFTWTPQQNQIGLQQFCATAYTSESVQSNPYCVIFIVETSPACVTTTSTSTSTTSMTITSTSTSTTVTTTSTTTTTSITTSSTSTTTTVSVTTATTTTITTSSTGTVSILANSGPGNLLLAIIFPIVAMLLIVAVIGTWIYFKKGCRRGTLQVLQVNKRRKDLKQDTFLSPAQKTTGSIGRRGKINVSTSSNQSNMQNRLKSSASYISKEAASTSLTVNEQTMNDFTHNPNPSNTFSIDDSIKNERSSGNQSESIHPAKTAESTKRLSTAPYAPSTVIYQTNELPSPILTKIHMVTLPRNKVSASFESGTGNQLNNQKNTVRTINVHIRDFSHETCKKSVKPGHQMRRRASSFDEVIVSRVKTARSTNHSFRDPSVKVIRSNNVHQ